MRNVTRSAFLVLVSVLVGCCSTKVYHRVHAGETLFRISKTYGVSVEAIVAANDIEHTTRLEVGQRLLIPGTGEARHGSHATDTEADDPEAVALSWPIGGGVVTSGFGQRKGSHHDGIDVSAPAGTAVRAAQDGDVLYSDVLRGYGNLIILRHHGGLSTVYAHNQINLVREGQRVRRGDIIARVGTSGHTSGANLHFEVRKDNVARNPVYYLPPSAQVALKTGDRDG